VNHCSKLDPPCVPSCSRCRSAQQITGPRSDRGAAKFSRLRVLHVTEAPLGGVLSCIQEIISAQARNPDFDGIYALMPEINVAPLRSAVPRSVHIYSFVHRRGSVAALARLAAGTLRMVRDVRPDILHVHSTIAGAVVRVCLLFRRGRPIILYCPHLWAFCQLRGRVARTVAAQVEWLLSFRTDRIICVSEYEKQEAIAAGIAEAKCTVVHNGIAEITDVRARYPRVGKTRILFVGRFDDQKGFDIYLEVLRRLGNAAEGVAVGGFIVNGGKPMVVPDNVTLLPWCSREALNSIYQQADLLLMPSRWESAPLVALEAMRVGLPVFASRVGGVPELVADGITGRLFEAGDTAAIVALIRATSNETLRSFGKSSVSRFQSLFTADRMSEALLSLYWRLVPDHSLQLMRPASHGGT
jgi:glycosyltransferase involved in cell wall biosynthesis